MTTRGCSSRPAACSFARRCRRSVKRAGRHRGGPWSIAGREKRSAAWSASSRPRSTPRNSAARRAVQYMADPEKQPQVDANQELARHRDAIDALDRELLKLLNERARQAQAIGALKGSAEAYRPAREAQLLPALDAQNAGPLPPEPVPVL